MQSGELGPTTQTSPSSSPEVNQALAWRIAKRQAALTPKIARSAPQISGLRKEAPDALSEALGNLLIFTAAQLNVVRNMTNTQIGLLVMDLSTRYWHWRLDEFIIVMREGVAGRWGKVYDRFDAPTIHDWCAAYETQVRAELIEHEALNQHGIYRQLESSNYALFPSGMHEAYTRKALETRTDEELKQGVAYYNQHPDAPYAALKSQTAADILADRAKKAEQDEIRAKELVRKCLSAFEQMEAGTLPTPELESEAVKHFAAAKAIPKPSDILTPAMQVVKDTNAA